MKLFDISTAFSTLFDSLENAQADPDRTDEEKAEYEKAWFDSLSMLEGLFEEKAENIGAWIKELNGEAEILREQEKAFAERRWVKERLAERLKTYLVEQMNAVNLKKIDRPMVKMYIRNNPESAQFADEKAFIAWAKENADDLLRYAEPEIARTKVKEYLQAGHEIEGVTLERSQSVIIR